MSEDEKLRDAVDAAFPAPKLSLPPLLVAALVHQGLMPAPQPQDGDSDKAG